MSWRKEGGEPERVSDTCLQARIPCPGRTRPQQTGDNTRPLSPLQPPWAQVVPVPECVFGESAFCLPTGSDRGNEGPRPRTPGAPHVPVLGTVCSCGLRPRTLHCLSSPCWAWNHGGGYAVTSICPDLWEPRPRGLCGTEGSSGLSSAGGKKLLAPGTWLWAGAASLPPGGPQWLSKVGVCPGTLSHACPLPDSGSCVLQQCCEVGKRDGPATTP